MEHNREGNLQAPTRHPIEWRDPAFHDEAALQKEQERIFDICHGCRRCVSLCGAFPTLFDLVDNSATMEIDGVAKEDYAEGRRPVLPVRHLLHDEVSVRSAASVERRLPARDAARKGRQVPEGRLHAARSRADEHRCRRQARDDSRRREGGEQGERVAAASQGRWKRCWASPRRRGCRRMPSTRFRSSAPASLTWPVRDGERTPGKVAIFATCYINYNEPGIGHDLLKLLAPHPGSVHARRKRSVLRHAEARARRSRRASKR